MDTALLHLVPIGEENAATARLIWKQYGVWTPASTKLKLNRLVLSGLIERKLVQKNSWTETSVYFNLPRDCPPRRRSPISKPIVCPGPAVLLLTQVPEDLGFPLLQPV